MGGGAVIKPEHVIDYGAILAVLFSLPVLIQGLRRRGTGRKYESLFWVQRAPQIAVFLNIGVVFAAFEFPRAGTMGLFSQLPFRAVVAWCGVGLYLSGLVFLVGGWYSLRENFSTDAEVLADHSVATGGLYRWVLHPVYSGIGQACFGAGLASGSIISLLITALLVVPLWYRRARYEERLLIERFGEQYLRYAESVHWRRIVPKFVPVGF